MRISDWSSDVCSSDLVWTIVNIENWSPDGAMPRTVLPPPMGHPLLPDVANWAWHEYGMRVGFWRFLDALTSRGLRASLAINGSACRVYAEACAAALQAGWEFMGRKVGRAACREREGEY